MKLFIKIFLWFLAAIALMMGVIIFVTRTFQTDPMVSRGLRSTRNQMIIYGGTANQIVNTEGEAGLRTYLTRLRDIDPPREVDLLDENGKAWFGEADKITDSGELISRTFTSSNVETDFSSEDRALGAAPVIFPDGHRFVLIMQWERQSPPALFWGSALGYWRLAGLLLTAFLLCYLLAMYLTLPIRKIREATHKLADGDLQTRVAQKVGRRRDELADLAGDFDEMAERIESLITSQQRLNSDISHELRSPLARLNVALEIAKQKSSPETEPFLNRIEIESHRLNEMISRLLILAKLESGSELVEPVRVDLAELVRDVAEDADFEAQAKGRSVKVSSDDPCTVMGSENLLRSAIENVLRNAVRYTAEGTAVDVSLVRQNGHS
ncbi:MAG TPA: histidine kinase dimerization/phospho-acceptor domain-containing protein, partial [Pyrinomonadaceae bacterium]|nr:histidine kinase dimerization/phospho-acceptor domain-containing protein [Pyrinomonadaceae bacterium]